MKSFGNFLVEQDEIEAAKKKLKKIPKGSKVSFSHSETGKKITGTYHGLKRLGAYSYAHVEHPKGVDQPNLITIKHNHQAREK